MIYSTLIRKGVHLFSAFSVSTIHIFMVLPIHPTSPNNALPLDDENVKRTRNLLYIGLSSARMFLLLLSGILFLYRE